MPCDLTSRWLTDQACVSNDFVGHAPIVRHRLHLWISSVRRIIGNAEAKTVRRYRSGGGGGGARARASASGTDQFGPKPDDAVKERHVALRLTEISGGLRRADAGLRVIGKVGVVPDVGVERVAGVLGRLRYAGRARVLRAEVGLKLADVVVIILLGEALRILILGGNRVAAGYHTFCGGSSISGLLALLQRELITGSVLQCG